MIRDKKLPAKFSAGELDQIKQAATAAGLSVNNYVRQQLNLPPVVVGPPAGNQNAVKPERINHDRHQAK